MGANGVGDQILSATMIELIGADEFSSVIANKTIREIARELIGALKVAMAIAAIRRQDVFSYTLNGRTLTASATLAKDVVAMLEKELSDSGGISMMPVEYGL